VAASQDLHLFKYVEDPDQQKISIYETHGGYNAWRKALAAMKPDEVAAEVKSSGLRGRGGAGFPAGMKWGFIPKDNPRPRYLICNADESEPGTCKDRVLMERDPHGVIEGMAIAAYAINCHLMFIYIRGEFGYSANVMRKAVEEAYQNGHLGKDIHGSGFDLEMVVHTGGGAYICGEETALMNSLEGRRGNNCQQCRDSGVGAAHYQSWRRVVQVARYREIDREQNLQPQRPRQTAGQLRTGTRAQSEGPDLLA
jgi:NADH-quinone oxidoreductase subunit F